MTPDPQNTKDIEKLRRLVAAAKGPRYLAPKIQLPPLTQTGLSETGLRAILKSGKVSKRVSAWLASVPDVEGE